MFAFQPLGDRHALSQAVSADCSQIGPTSIKSMRAYGRKVKALSCQPNECVDSDFLLPASRYLRIDSFASMHVGAVTVGGSATGSHSRDIPATAP